MKKLSFVASSVPDLFLPLKPLQISLHSLSVFWVSLSVILSWGVFLWQVKFKFVLFSLPVFSPSPSVMKDPSTETSNVASQAQPFSAGGNGYSHKVRKPYVITKQREKWTANEHQRFVEALKLYGRGWRQIEEYVGTKTAIQIRSHAQKFFAKVSRDTGACGEGLLNLEDIPPPRPKKKPLHPYPRKTENKEDTDSNALECLTDDGEKYSPTSVASAVNSDNIESAVAEMHSSCPSPTSCATDALSGNLLTSANFSAVPPGDNLIKKSHQDSESTMESPFCAGQRTSFKLFGKTVVVVNGAGQSSDVMGSSESRPESPDDQLVHGFIPPLPTASPPYPPQANNNDLKRDQSAWCYTCLLHPYLPGTAAADFNTMLTNTPIQIRDGV